MDDPNRDVSPKPPKEQLAKTTPCFAHDTSHLLKKKSCQVLSRNSDIDWSPRWCEVYKNNS